jgi:hypothetical protein
MERRLFALWMVILGVLIGVLGNVLFYGKYIGLSFPLFIGVCIAVVLGIGIAARRPLRWRNLWTLLPMAFFAVMVAVRADQTISWLDIAAVLALGALALHYRSSERNLDEDTAFDYGAAVATAGLYTLGGAAPELGDSWGWLREKGLRDRGALVAVGRGLLIALPVVVIFAILLGSADLVFAKYLDKLWQALSFQNADDLIGHGVFTFGLGWVATGALAYGLVRRTVPTAPPAAASEGDPDPSDEAGEEALASDERKRMTKPFKLGMIESAILLGSVDALFGAFVLIQFAYFFGGTANISATGFTYAQYARRGFFELVAVSVLTLGLALFLDWATVREGKRQNQLFRGLAVVVVALTTVMLVSAAQRMWLYEEAYGFTHLRVYTHVFIVWLGAAFVFFLLALFRVHKNIFSLGLLLVVIGYLGTLNLMDVEGYIAQRNIARYHEGRELDIPFLRTLSVDALPAMIDLYREGKSTTEINDGIGQWLAKQLYELDQSRADLDSTIFSTNFSRQRAWSLLDAMRGELPTYDPQLYWQIGAND